MAFRVCQTFGRTYQEDAYTSRGRQIWNVWSDTDITDISEVLDAPGLPALGDAWDDSIYTYLLASKLTPTEVGRETKFYQVAVDYEDDGTNMPWIIDLGTSRMSWVPNRTLTRYDEAPVLYADGRYLSPSGAGGDDTKEGYPVVNRAGDFFEDQPQTERHITHITLTKTYASIGAIGDSTITDINELMDYKGTMNNNLVTVAGLEAVSWELLIDDIRVRRKVTAAGTYVFEVTYVIVFNKDFGWATPIANIGYRALKTAGGTDYVTPGRNADGTGNNKPVLLDTDGTAITDREAPSASGGGPPYYIVFPFFESSDFSELGLPTTIE